MKQEERHVVVLDIEDKYKLVSNIKALEEVAKTYQKPCSELTNINNVVYLLKSIEEKIY